MPPSRHSLAGKCIEVEGGAVNIEPFVLQKRLRAGFHVYRSALRICCEPPSVTSPMRPALHTRCANPTFLSRATFPWPLPWPWPCVRVRSDAASISDLSPSPASAGHDASRNQVRQAERLRKMPVKRRSGDQRPCGVQ